jgi:hypothetical protein
MDQVADSIHQRLSDYQPVEIAPDELNAANGELQEIRGRLTAISHV